MGGRPRSIEAILTPIVQPAVDELAHRLTLVDPASRSTLPGWTGLFVRRVTRVLETTIRAEWAAADLVGPVFAAADLGGPVFAAAAGGVRPGPLGDRDGDWLAARYPEGARLVQVVLGHAVGAAVELHERLRADRERLEDAFGVLADDPVVDVAPGLGDSHRGGRAAAALVFASGRRLVYKPRSVRPEQALETLLAAVARELGDHRWCPVDVLDRGPYGWAEFVRGRPVDTAVAIDRFFRRAGSLLAVAVAVGLGDLHPENLVAAGDRPVVVDAELLMPAVPLVEMDALAADPVAPAVAASVWGTMLLPHGQPVHRQHRDRPAGLVAQLGGLGRVDRREAIGATAPPIVNLPVRAGQVQDARPHADAIVAGFRAAAEVLRDRHDDWGRPGAPLDRLWRTPVRGIVRTTSAYAAALGSATTPACLRSAATRRAVLIARLGAGPGPAALRGSELPDLVDGDIPMLTAEPGRALLRPAGPARAGDAARGIHLQRAPADAARARITALDGMLVEREVDRIRASLTRPWPPTPHRAWLASADGAGEVAGRESPLGADRVPAVRAAVTAIAHLVVDSRIERGGRVGWLGVRRDPVTSAIAGGPLGPGLMDGSAGIAVFLARSGKYLRRDAWVALAGRAVDDALHGVARALRPDAARHGSRVDLGLQSGVGGLIWAAARIATDLGRPESLEAASAIAAAAWSQVRPRARPDLDEGAAGLLAGLAELIRAAGAVDRPDVGERAAAIGPAVCRLVVEGENGPGSAGSTATERRWRSAALADWSWVTGDARARTAAAAMVDGLVGPGTGRPVRAALAARAAGRRSSVPARPTSGAFTVSGDGLRDGLAGVLAGSRPEEPDAGAIVALLTGPVDRLRLIGPGVVPWLAPGLGDGLAGVGTALLQVVDGGPPAYPLL